MQIGNLKKLPPKPLGTGSSSALQAPSELVRVVVPDCEWSVPTVVRSSTASLDLAGWIRENAESVETLFWRRRAVLFRGFGLRTAADFEKAALAASKTEALNYRDRSTPRTEKKDRVYTSTVYPSEETIRPHNEGTYWVRWALKLFFCCIRKPSTGGQTPIYDTRRVLEGMPTETRRIFQEKGFQLIRNYNHGFGLRWQEVFQTESRAEVEAYCRTNAIEWEWKGGQGLKTWQTRPAIRRHPRLGVDVWFNHAAFFHVSSLEPAVRDALIAELGEDNLPYNTRFGDGSPIPSEVIETINSLYEQEKTVFDWEEGDMLMLDNMSIAHGREPYEGEREVLVIMTEPHGEAAV